MSSFDFSFKGARGLPGERGRVGAPGPAVSGFPSVCHHEPATYCGFL